MKIKTPEAARELGVHPARLFQFIAELDSSLPFGDVWPTIDRGFIDTISAMGHHHNIVQQESEQPTEPVLRPTASIRVSADSRHILDKLERQSKWGSVAVTFEALLNLTRLSKRDLEDALHELRKAKLLAHDGSGRKTISLNSAMRGEIESLVQQERSIDK